MTEPTDAAPARRLWQRLETVHAVTYFAPESVEGAAQAGLRGFWMGYFGFRAAPIGPAPAAVVQAIFANFAPVMVERSLPDAWSYASPEALVDARAAAAAGALRRISPRFDEIAAELGQTLAQVAAHADPLGRPLFAANRALPDRDDPVEQLWQCCTTLREHRGDGHVMALAGAGVDGCEAHQLHLAATGHPASVIRDNRGWTTEQWDGATDRLRNRGLLRGDALSDSGAALRADIEALTDRLAIQPFTAALSPARIEGLEASLDDAARLVLAADVLPFPNPMGLPRV